MKRALFLLALLAACRGQDPVRITAPQPQALPKPEPVYVAQDLRNANVDELMAFDPAAVIEGSALKADAGAPIVLTMELRESPEGLITAAEWLDEDGDTLVRQRKQMNGAKVAEFTLPRKVAPGHYRVVGYWGGNVAAEYEFEVVR